MKVFQEPPSAGGSVHERASSGILSKLILKQTFDQTAKHGNFYLERKKYLHVNATSRKHGD